MSIVLIGALIVEVFFLLDQEPQKWIYLIIACTLILSIVCIRNLNKKNSRWTEEIIDNSSPRNIDNENFVYEELKKVKSNEKIKKNIGKENIGKEKNKKNNKKEDIVINCSTCVNNIEYPPPHTCDICTSLDQEEEYEMWEPKDK